MKAWLHEVVLQGRWPLYTSDQKWHVLLSWHILLSYICMEDNEDSASLIAYERL